MNKIKIGFIIILSCCFASNIGCSVSKNVVRENEKILSEEKKPIDPTIEYNFESVSYLNDKITIAFKKLKINQEEKITKTQYDLVEHRTLYRDSTRDSCVLISLPYSLIESIDRNLGTKTEHSKEIIHISEQPLTIENGYIVIKEENIKAPIIDGKAVIDSKKLKLKKDSYEIMLFENNSLQLTTTMHYEAEELAYEAEVSAYRADTATILKLLGNIRDFRSSSNDTEVQKKARERKLKKALVQINSRYKGTSLTLQRAELDNVTAETVSSGIWSSKETGKYNATYSIPGPEGQYRRGIAVGQNKKNDDGTDEEFRQGLPIGKLDFGSFEYLNVKIVKSYPNENSVINLSKGSVAPLTGTIRSVLYEDYGNGYLTIWID